MMTLPTPGAPFPPGKGREDKSDPQIFYLYFIYATNIKKGARK